MTKAIDGVYAELARKALEEDPHYVVTVAQMGDVKRIITSEEVFTAKGMKLLDKGVVIDSGLSERLLQHKLLKPIDQSLTVDDGITAAALAAAVSSLFETQAYLRQLFPLAVDRENAAAALARLDLSPQLAFKLTVAREQRPHLFAHTLVVALIAHYLSLHLQLSASEKADLLLAALLHDLGELHTNPVLLESRRRLDPDEMRYIYAHPITGYLIAKAAAPTHPEAATIVLLHQERLDGSGYPHGLRTDAIVRSARIVAVADVCASILARFGNSGRLSALMRLNHDKYDAALIALLQKAFGPLDEDDAGAAATARPQLVAVADLLRRWGDFRASLARPPRQLTFLFERMVGLNSMLLQFGFDPSSLRLLLALVAEDSKIAGELAAALNEMHWQFTDLEREIVRHRATDGDALSPADNLFLEGWLADLQRYLATAPTPG